MSIGCRTCLGWASHVLCGPPQRGWGRHLRLPPPSPPAHAPGNDLSGTIPASWAQLPSLKQLYVRPGNERLCGRLPPNATFQLCDASGNSACSLQVSLDSSPYCQAQPQTEPSARRPAPHPAVVGLVPTAAAAAQMQLLSRCLLWSAAWWAWRASLLQQCTLSGGGGGGSSHHGRPRCCYRTPAPAARVVAHPRLAR